MLGSEGMDRQIVADILASDVADPAHLWLFFNGMYATWYSGVAFLWVAAALTVITGVDYFRKALPHLRD